MENDVLYTSNRNKLKSIWLIPFTLIAVILGWAIANIGITIGMMVIVLPFVIAFVIVLFYKPRFGIYFFLVYCFLMPTLGKHIVGIQFGLGMDAILVLIVLSLLFNTTNRYRIRHLNNDLFWIAFVWFVITVLQIGNPERPSFEGWFYEMRSTTLYWILTVSTGYLLLNKKKDVNIFLNIIIILSLLGALYGVKQNILGPDAAEMRWLEAGAKVTHILFGKLRIFSYYPEAAQFGASQAQLSIMCFILAVGPYSKAKKLGYLIAAVIIFYGMLLSGTRGAMAALVGGGFTFLVLSKQIKMLILGSVIGLGFLGMLKYTTIGNGNAQIVRFRTSLDPEDPSLQARLRNQKKLSEFIKNKPFGAGVGTMGNWGTKYNADKFISTIPPDSMYVKIWGMYGIVGFIIWFGSMMYITGKCSGIIWKTRDPVLKNQLTSICAGATGILLCSYGNEVMNAMPSSAVIYFSWVIIWLSPRWDTPLPVGNSK
ncbi:O-antigen ligase [Emticicia sp. 21SJ11W-3]|uniref:O-antigen ligase family protein n=1 Tax=Emticicia sp. 21SJ11W-3 TaxID=2916755 RepID=UPI00209CC749|nr:O-antigen ligase family protein [Emticicia sp. 21SJ11W-3]UTA69538.1 O-antigen ligase family protein [Emticicia sp. 21SJ11W-3]